MTERVVISGYYGFGNFGDEAILSVLVSHLKKFGHEVIVLSSNPRNTSINLGVNAVNSFSIGQVRSVIKSSDVLISGGGSLLQDVTSLKSLIYYLFIIFLAKLYKKKVIIFAQGIGPINNPIARFVTFNILKSCDYVSVRDRKSQELLESNGIKSDLLCDPIFSVEFASSNEVGRVGVQLRSFPTLNEDFLYKLARQVIEDFREKKIEIYSLQDGLDMAICEKFESILKEFAPDINTEIVNEMVSERISHLEYMISMRFHALLVAMKMGIKCLGINYDKKVEKLCKEAGVPILNMSRTQDFEDIFNTLKSENSADIKAYADSNKFDWSGIDRIFS